MSCGCGTDHSDGKAIIDRLRVKGLADKPMKQSYQINCECQSEFTMTTFSASCPQCGMVFGVTPCSQHALENIKPAGVNY
ncbi:hypothetical protein [Aliagarivorans taiwanensis]|uniref:hypothetical protein n=1 Tax=Aliagarivorans taiwanensis TaxID=561966 RepID=UPI0003F7A3AF|nr:hypothetical protein [Aliagarivorans taiwanensis]